MKCKKLFAVLLPVILFCACLPTPEEDFVVQKDSETLLEKATADAAPHAQHIESSTAYTYCTVTFDFDLPETANSYPIYAASKGGVSAEAYANLLHALSMGQEWQTVSGKTLDPTHLGRGSFQAIRPAGDGHPRAELRGNVNGSNFTFLTRFSRDNPEMVIGMREILPITNFEEYRALADLLEGTAPPLSYEEALQIADACVSEAGCFDHYRLQCGERAAYITLLDTKASSDGWRFTYTPAFCGLQTAYEDGWSMRRGDFTTTGAPWEPMEALILYVEQEIVYAQLYSYTDYVQQQDAAVLSGADAVAQMERLLQKQFDVENKDVRMTEITVPRVTPIYAVIENE